MILKILTTMFLMIFLMNCDATKIVKKEEKADASAEQQQALALVTASSQSSTSSTTGKSILEDCMNYPMTVVSKELQSVNLKEYVIGGSKFYYGIVEVNASANQKITFNSKSNFYSLSEIGSKYSTKEEICKDAEDGNLQSGFVSCSGSNNFASCKAIGSPQIASVVTETFQTQTVKFNQAGKFMFHVNINYTSNEKPDLTVQFIE